MKNFNKSLLAIIALCFIVIQSNSTKINSTKKFESPKRDSVVKIWNLQTKYLPQRNQFLLHPSLTKLIASCLCPDACNYEHMPLRNTNFWERKSLLFSENITLPKDGWAIKIRSTPPFCDVEPLEQGIPVY